ncbi:NUC189-domain-containing protein [Trichoderma citrinoviride]|uniref:NUC189-domain-containing protein n=1 Tax=Trichoderma citrinoviride TaxID=58853 RepID=A0A2T4B196_9HYPO|nr:NUC189-domain-containing protein [Trichoderma citrinoviride]PTB63008.1 NUC189-domain-containing protein [Trichoderma citrinoviride]
MSTPKRRTPAKLATPVVKPDARRTARNTIDESRTTVAGADALRSSQAETIEISSDPDSDEDMSDVEDVNGAADEAEQNPEQKPLANGQPKQSGKDDEAESDAEETSPSFGELLRGSEAIDVTAMLQQSSADSSNAAAQASRSAIAPPSHQSLTTVLTQALKTDDTDLLESCLHTTDIHTIRNTIERIDSSLAGILLNKVAARLHRRPGRAGTLMTWVQWTLVAHGGALAAQPKLLHDLNSLQKVLAERAKGLNSLLALKGKLDILEGQMELRRRMQRSAGLLGEGEDADEEDVIYVEGEERDAEQKNLANGVRSRRRGETGADADDDEDDDDRVLNGFIGDSEDDEEGSEQDEEESDAEEDQLDEDEVDFDDVDESMGEDEESDVEVAPPTKMQKVSKTSGKKK